MMQTDTQTTLVDIGMLNFPPDRTTRCNCNLSQTIVGLKGLHISQGVGDAKKKSRQHLVKSFFFGCFLVFCFLSPRLVLGFSHQRDLCDSLIADAGGIT